MKVDVFIFENRLDAENKIGELQVNGRTILWDGVEHDGQSLAGGLLALDKPGIFDFLTSRGEGNHIVIAEK
jgi:hypothetical protein